MNDHERAAKLRAKGKMTESATERAKRRESRRGSHRNAPATEAEMSSDDRSAMQRLIGAPRDEESRARGRASRRAAADGSGGESFADRSARSTTGWFGRRGR